MAARLLDKNAFPKVMEAIANNEKTKFKNLCKDAGISVEMADDMWKLIKYESRENIRPCW